jgi:predicted acetyltransferase
LHATTQLTEADYKDIFALSQFAFQYELSEAELNQKEAEAARHRIWGIRRQGQLAAKMHIIPLSCSIHGRTFAMGGVSSVATWPEYRRQGMVKHLLHHGLEQMKQYGQLISLLHPFSVPFYRKYGWELAFTEKHYTIPIGKMTGSWQQASGYICRTERDIPLLNSIYQDYAQNFTGMLIRDGQWWNQRVLKENPHIAVAYNEAHQPEGYVLYKVKEETFHVYDMAYTTTNGRKLLLQFIQNHDSMVKQVKMTASEHDNLPLLMDEPRFAQKIIPYFMARIVDVPAFLRQYPFGDCPHSVTLHVQDAFFPENSGVYRIGNGGSVTARSAHTKQAQGISCTIQSLTAMLLGYRRPAELYELEWISGSQAEVERLEALIPEQQPYFADFF